MRYIRSKAEALDAVAAVLALPERRQQIVQLTVRVAMCLDPSSRSFLADCQAGLVEGGLEYMRKRRHDLLAATQQEAPEAIVIVDSTEDQLLDFLRTANVVSDKTITSGGISKRNVSAKPCQERPGTYWRPNFPASSSK